VDLVGEHQPAVLIGLIAGSGFTTELIRNANRVTTKPQAAANISHTPGTARLVGISTCKIHRALAQTGYINVIESTPPLRNRACPRAGPRFPFRHSIHAYFRRRPLPAIRQRGGDTLSLLTRG
jgi:hypothetical protein